MGAIINKIKESSVLTFTFQTAIPFMIPFITEVSDNHISPIAKAIIIVISSILDLAFIFSINQKERMERSTAFNDRAARYAYSNAYELNEIKRDYYINHSYDSNYFINPVSLPYNVHEYISDICKSFKNVISEIVDINKESISVSFIYRYRYSHADEESKQWRWVTGRELNTLTPLNEFVKKEDTVYYRLINEKSTVIFYNDKASMAKEGKYHISPRDKRHNTIGSIFGVQILFSNNAQAFSEGILVISTYGKRFLENGNEESIIQLKRLIIDDLFPYYQRLLETELGVLYLRHLGKSENNNVNITSQN